MHLGVAPNLPVAALHEHIVLADLSVRTPKWCPFRGGLKGDQHERHIPTSPKEMRLPQLQPGTLRKNYVSLARNQEQCLILVTLKAMQNMVNIDPGSNDTLASRQAGGVEAQKREVDNNPVQHVISANCSIPNCRLSRQRQAKQP